MVSKNLVHWSQLLLLLVNTSAFALASQHRKWPVFPLFYYLTGKINPGISTCESFVCFFVLWLFYLRKLRESEILCAWSRVVPVTWGQGLLQRWWSRAPLPASYMNVSQTSPVSQRLVKPPRAWLAVTASTKSESKVWVLWHIVAFLFRRSNLQPY